MSEIKVDIILSVFAGLSFIANVYQYYRPRSLGRLTYRVSSVSLPERRINAIMDKRLNMDSDVRMYQALKGIAFEIRSTGSRSAEKVLLHVSTKHPIVYADRNSDFVLPSSSSSSRPNEINISETIINPGDRVTIRVFCEESVSKNDECILEEHRLSHSEKYVKMVNEWKD